jgi:S-adenosylmethionine/arginine decarboxylase-like enzyme
MENLIKKTNMEMTSGDYGKELVLDIHNCNIEHFNRADLEKFFIDLCEVIDMERADLHFWDDLYVPEDQKQTEPHLVGTSAIQFIKTSNVTIHTLDIMRRVYLNIFSCKDFDADTAKDFCVSYFAGEVVNCQVFRRV